MNIYRYILPVLLAGVVVACSEDKEEADAPVVAPDGYENGHAYVDLGLTSGNKWAIQNINATVAKFYGSYFAWGELYTAQELDPDNSTNYKFNKYITHEKTYFNFKAYKYCNGAYNSLTKYNNNETYGKVDNTLSIDETDDVAAVKWGGSWHMPSASDFQELIDECVIEWTRSYNNTGYPGIIVFKCKDESDKGRAIEERDSLKLTSRYSLLEPHIFIPSAGYASDSSIVMSAVDNGYWTSDIDKDEPYKAKVLQFRYADINITADYRSKGYTIRPVTK